MKLDLYNIPHHMHQSIQDYVDHGYNPGSFFRAVLLNNLIESAEKADEFNKHRLFDYAFLLYNEIPSAARGSNDKIDAWVKAGGMDQYE